MAATLPAESAAAVAAALGLEPHPEGGFFKRWFTDVAADGARPAASSILYLLPLGGTCSLHALADSAELWFHQAGAALEVVTLLPDGGVRAERVRPGAPLAVSAGAVFGARLRAVAPGEPPYALVACAVAPAFEWAAWRHPSRAELRARFPGAAAAAVIEELGRPDADAAA
jgi:predicted cupin superfamily sugar epimerase